MSRSLTARRVAPLLFCSGWCGLVYQVGWLRELRLIFGASTAASAAVLAIFIGGLGVGGLWIGARVDRAKRPLQVYAYLELAIAGSAALSPLLLAAVRALYILAGGTPALGMFGGTVVRLVLAALVLAVPTVAMGGTLSAATRSIEVDSDSRRRQLALLYGVNTLGAVAGALISTFVLLEVFGTRATIWVAALVNALVAVTARSMARGAAEVPVTETETSAPATSAAPVGVVLVASATAGFVFFLMEMTWYRMLAPILGGSVFTFGLILAIALLGLGIGGLAYTLRPAARQATVRGLVLTCAIEAIGLAIPWALGDRIAIAAIWMRDGTVFGFAGQALGWAVICAIVVLPAAIASGVQFPLLVNLVGGGRAAVGRHLGWVYATNTLGAITGSLLGGFVLLPGLGAVHCWRLAVELLLALGVAVTAVHAARKPRAWLPIGAAVAVAIALLSADGPTAAWRHSSIGVGRAGIVRDAASARDFIALNRRSVKWEREGVESSVALQGWSGIAFVINGKVDGNVVGDKGTQIMGGLVGALVHPAPRRALVIGLGTGQTAGWLADAPEVEQVDVVELEPAILEAARQGAATNRNVLTNPKVRLHIGDAREQLLVGRDAYDIIFSEPSNPYRAGVASLYTREFYEAVRERLGEHGLFLQWMQAYEVDGATVETVAATLLAVFPDVHIWRLTHEDLLFVASSTPIRYDAGLVARRLSSPAARDALSIGWDVTGVEGFFSHFVGDTRLVRELARRPAAQLNTDDRTVIEFGFARSLGRSDLHNVLAIRELARTLAVDRPDAAIDESRFRELRAFVDAGESYPDRLWAPELAGDSALRARARALYLRGDLAAAGAAWQHQTGAPILHVDHVLLAEARAIAGDDTALAEPDLSAGELKLIEMHLRIAQGRADEAAVAFVAGAVEMRRDAFFAETPLASRALHAAVELASRVPAQASAIAGTLEEPFALYVLEEDRVKAMLAVASQLDDRTFAQAISTIEPNVPWTRDVLARRATAYAAIGDPRAAQAQRDLAELLASEPSAIAPPD